MDINNSNCRSNISEMSKATVYDIENQLSFYQVSHKRDLRLDFRDELCGLMRRQINKNYKPKNYKKYKYYKKYNKEIPNNILFIIFFIVIIVLIILYKKN
jgi:hypothetical protein